MKAALRADRMRTLIQARTKSESGSKTPNLFGTSDEIADRAVQLWQDGVFREDKSYNVSDACLQETEMFLEALTSGEMWALKSKLLFYYYLNWDDFADNKL